jgi:hypothetical protein
MSTARQQASNWTAISQFMSDLKNASRLATLVDTVVDMYESGAWRRYTDAAGRSDEWREREYDYFLIACGAEYADVQRLLTWDRAHAVELAAAMESEDPRKRRPLEEASGAWLSPTGTPLIEVAARQGWTTSVGTLRVSPAPARARTLARHGITMDEHARQQREQLISAQRRRELDRQADDLAKELGDLELRYLRDRITAKLAKARMQPGRSA